MVCRVDQCCLDVLGVEPFEDRFADELRAIVGTQITRCTACADQSAQDLDHPSRADAAGDVDRQTLAGELVDQREALELLSVGTRDRTRSRTPRRDWPCVAGNGRGRDGRYATSRSTPWQLQTGKSP